MMHGTIKNKFYYSFNVIVLWRFVWKSVMTSHITITEAVSEDKKCRLNCSTAFNILFQETFIILPDPKSKYINFLLHTIYLTTYINIKPLHYQPQTNFTKCDTYLFELPCKKPTQIPPLHLSQVTVDIKYKDRFWGWEFSPRSWTFDFSNVAFPNVFAIRKEQEVT